MITVLTDAVSFFQQFNTETSNSKPNATLNLRWKQLSEQLEDEVAVMLKHCNL